MAYYTLLIVCGIPLFYLECIIAQFSGFDAISVWRICPLFKGRIVKLDVKEQSLNLHTKVMLLSQVSCCI